MSNNDYPIDLRKAFKHEQSLREKFRADFENVIKHILSGIDLLAIDSRTKTEDSFMAKAVRPGKCYSDPIEEITDLTGIRVVVEYKDEARIVADKLQRSLRIDQGNSWADRCEATESDFGYSAIHLVARITDQLAEKFSCQPILDKKFEIQIRTNLENAWATKSRNLIYEKDVPKEYKRAFNRLSALLEIAEESFQALRDKIQIIPTVSATHALSDSELSIDDVIDLIKNCPPIKTVVKLLSRSGLKVSESARKDFSQAILDILARQGVNSKKEAEEYIGDNATAVAKACELYMQATDMKSFLKDSLLVAALAIVGNGDISPEDYASAWNDRWKNGFLKASKEFTIWRKANPN